MDEDIEIEQLLESNEQLLMEAAKSDNNEEDIIVKDKDKLDTLNHTTVQDTSEDQHLNLNMLTPNENEKSKEVNFLSEKNNSKLRPIRSHSISNQTYSKMNYYSESDEEVNDVDELQELLNYHIVSQKAKIPNKYFQSFSHMYYDDERSMTMGGTDLSDKFISEIVDSDESEFKASVPDQLHQQDVDISKQSIQEALNDLVYAKRQNMVVENNFKNLEEVILNEIREIKQKQEEIRNKLLPVTKLEHNKSPCLSRLFYKTFGMPYFEDANGFGAPPNKDHKIKMKRGDLVVPYIPKISHWTGPQKKLLQDAIKWSIVDEKSTKLKNEIKKLKAKSERDTDKIRKCQRELRLIKLKPYRELALEQNPNREYDWMKFSATVFDGKHSPEQCKRFWHVYLKPSINKSNWDNDEDVKLLELAQKNQYQDWDTIAELLKTNRSAYQCLVHFQTRYPNKHDTHTGKWTKEEDQNLISIINSSKIGNFIPWLKVSSHICDRSHTQIYSRFKNCLNPELVKGRFSKEEDLLIVSGIEVFGASYTEMSTLFRNRSVNQIRERYERYLLPKTAKVGVWSLEEDEKLLKLVQKFGEGNWTSISKEMKTRSRTQIRQRHNWIKRMIESKPGWSITQANRKNSTCSNKFLKHTEKEVFRVKKEIAEAEQKFKLSKVESDTYRIEKLKCLRDSILIKKYNPKRKKKVFSDSSEVNNVLIEFFKHCSPKPPVKARIDNSTDISSYLNEIMLMAKYFKHKLKLPESESEIFHNPRLPIGLKHFLWESVKNQTSDAVFANEQNAASVSGTNLEENSINIETNGIHPEKSIDYQEPETDESIIMSDCWYSSPFDITCLNFSEIFKRTVFEYSNGIHKDIWASKVRRSENIKKITNSNMCKNNPVEVVPISQNPIMPPNHLNTLGLRSLLLGRLRLRRDVTEKGFSRNLYKKPPCEEVNIKDEDVDEYMKQVDQFEETLTSLFTWPKVLAGVNIGSTIVKPISSERVLRLRMNQLRTENEMSDYLDSCSLRQRLKKVGRKAGPKQNTKAASKLRRKQKIEHLVANGKSESDANKKKTKQVPKKKSSNKANKGSNNISQPIIESTEENVEKEKDNSFIVMQTNTTYSRKTRKRTKTSENTCSPILDKKPKRADLILPTPEFCLMMPN